MPGSSPLTRGKLEFGGGDAQGVELIPAHARKTRTHRRTHSRLTAHPRSCGENSPCSASYFAPWGSSPLTRGKHELNLRSGLTERLIPTHAGKTPQRPTRSAAERAHPHSCGENRTDDCHKITKRGSPPLTRGKLPILRGKFSSSGLIPAHARKTECKLDGCSACRAHPRSCGENTDRSLMSTSGKGSSPLTRGKQRRRPRERCAAGLIPAHAGKTRSQYGSCREPRAHPRSHGENWISGAQLRGSEGSSPLTRGKRGRRLARACGCGLIPAHAGKTTRRVSRSQPTTAHPRSRGENMSSPASGVRIRGSSPLTRGKQEGPARRIRPGRLIPAHAGKTGLRRSGPLG